MSKLSRYNLLNSLIQSELRLTHTLNGQEASDENNLIINHSIRFWVFLSEDLMMHNDLTEQARDTRIKNLLFVLNHSDFLHVILCLKKAYDLLLDHISQKTVLQDYLDFKGLLGEYGDLIGKLFSPIKESLLHVLQSKTVVSIDCYRNESTDSMWVCSHFLTFLKKLELERPELEEQALKDYLQFEGETSNLDVLGYQPFLNQLQNIIYLWFKDWNYDGLDFQHGPGSVADSKRGKFSKYSALANDAKVKYLYKDICSPFPDGTGEATLRRTSKLIFVPKDVSKLRSISMEPSTLQYLQQGCMSSLYAYFSKHKDLKHILNLSDQEQNKALAYQGSITNEYATLDLSHASDSVNWVLVKQLFKKVPRLLKWLICTRSTHTDLPTGVNLELSKFAPMGSALCFPIESIIFAASAKLAVSEEAKKSQERTVETTLGGFNTFISVYGDDIIISPFAANKCITVLEALGFRVNDEKSYTQGPFKESCGGNYFCGRDITGIKFNSSILSDRKLSPESYSGLCSYANIAYEHNLPMLRLCCIKTIFEAGLKPMFCDSLDASPMIFSPTPTNFHLKVHWKKDLQKHVVRYTSIVDHLGDVSVEAKEKGGNIFLFDYLLQRRNRKCSVYESQLNARMCKNTLEFDVSCGYDPRTAYVGTLKFSTCEYDVVYNRHT